MYNIDELNNGIKIVTEEIPFVRSISFGIWVKVGSQHENLDTNGISHFIEHMIFKGTKKRNAKKIAEDMDAIGGQINAFTTKQMTCFYFKILDENFDKALEIMADMFLNSSFDEKEMSREKKVILEEINMYEDTPEELVFEVLNQKVFDGSSLAYPILGSTQNVESFSHNDIANYYNNNYTGDNIIISVAGNFKKNNMLDKIKSYFGDIKNTSELKNKLESEPKYKKSIVLKQKNIEQVHICLGFPGVKNNLDDIYKLALFNTIFGGGMSSRLYQKIREENGLAYSLFSYNYSFDNIGLFSIYAGINPNKVEDCVKLIISEIKNLEFNKITQEELLKTKEQLKASYLLGLESSSSRMNALGKSMILYNKILTPDEIINKINQVSLKEIQELINQIFDFDKISLSCVGKNKYDFEMIINNAR